MGKQTAIIIMSLDKGLTVCSTLTLVLPYVVSAINEKMMYIFAAVNVLSIPIGTLFKFCGIFSGTD